MSDASLYISLANLLSCSSLINQKLDDSVLNFVRNEFSVGEYVTLPNVLGLLLCYTPAIGISSEKIAYIVEKLTNDEDVIDAEVDKDSITEFFESLQLVTVDQLVQQTAKDLVKDTSLQCQDVGNGAFRMDEKYSDKKEMVFKFVQSKIWWSSKYLQTIDKYDAYFSLLAGYIPFERWYIGEFKPFIYYNQRAAKLPISYTEYWDLDFDGKFSLFIQNLNQNNCKEWLNSVILPLIDYNGGHFHLLAEWLFLSEEERNLINSYKLWSSVLITLRGNSGQLELMNYYIASCYYYTIWHAESQISQMQNIKIHDSIREALSNINGIDESSVVDTPQLSALLSTSYTSFHSFVNDPATSFLVESPSLLLDIIHVCEKLNTTTKLSIHDFIDLKYKSNSLSRQKEAMKIMNGVNETNWKLVLESLEIFKGAFIDQSSEESISLTKLVINRFLQANLFKVVDELYKTGAIQIEVDEYFQVLQAKFWEFFQLSTNLNDKIGKLHLAHELIPLFNTITSNQKLNEKCASQIIQIKHLLKAISNMKNFKIVIERGVPVTPGQIINQYSSFHSESNSPMDLISLILEQNPKSYLAYEKLYRILNDLILGIPNIDSSSIVDGSIARLKSTCIEAALIDNNFQFAYTKSMELFEHFRTDVEEDSIISKTWLTFYQVGKYVSPSWYDDEGDKDGIARNKIDTLLKQREILSLLLKFNSSIKVTSSDNSRLILGQLAKLNYDIEEWYESEVEWKSQGKTLGRSSIGGSSFENQKIGAIAGDIVNEATHTTHQASEKLSNLFVSGLGWAIGANLE
ncbi:hypothetical protein CLIB1423_11S04170 [[Candida] railenensis]|uniref:Sec39 domain-containing protein n=1 Tax=[Candida] railenensis TaxID=45579 RepID=A0A9P0QQG8_9ASCO|nr:hypothetical protein CLIB1423_11S04170 [[Candida] railenensis]